MKRTYSSEEFDAFWCFILTEGNKLQQFIDLTGKALEISTEILAYSGTENAKYLDNAINKIKENLLELVPLISSCQKKTADQISQKLSEEVIDFEEVRDLAYKLMMQIKHQHLN